jgi:hypothetical protein
MTGTGAANDVCAIAERRQLMRKMVDRIVAVSVDQIRVAQEGVSMESPV